ncbi:hypothetical protein ZWY2020_029223 [Hordeum vulgare]|nr:hypothetical protein ZWY2020_029223 [Hordeum vulgare]
MDDLLPHEIVERELELQEVAETEERFVEELHVDKDEVEKSLSTEESVVDYQCELWRCHYYQYYNLEGGADEDEEIDAVDFSRRTHSSPMAACRRDKSSLSQLTPARHRVARWWLY